MMMTMITQVVDPVISKLGWGGWAVRCASQRRRRRTCALRSRAFVAIDAGCLLDGPIGEQVVRKNVLLNFTWRQCPT